MTGHNALPNICLPLNVNLDPGGDGDANILNNISVETSNDIILAGRTAVIDHSHVQGVVEPFMSDHEGIILKVNHSVKAVNSRFVCRPMTRKAIDNFKTEVLQTNWKLCHINIEDQAQTITNTLSDIYLRNFPEKEISVGGNSHITNIANTQKFKYLKSKLDAAQTMFNVTKSKASFELLRFLRKEYHAMINMEKVKLNNKYISESDNIQKTAWNIITPA
ncbi:hypothetical protein JTB14_006367 [Gonioctena quinquepunctata]|nr:hypothetical protein JTB14_006367 [Gonioctena quinquepunctata]